MWVGRTVCCSVLLSLCWTQFALDVSLHSWITNSGLQMLKSYPRSYPDLRPDSLGGFSQRQLDFVTWRRERPLQWTELKKPFTRTANKEWTKNTIHWPPPPTLKDTDDLNDWESWQSQPRCFYIYSTSTFSYNIYLFDTKAHGIDDYERIPLSSERSHSSSFFFAHLCFSLSSVFVSTETKK